MILYHDGLEIDLSERFEVRGQEGIAFWVKGWAQHLVPHIAEVEYEDGEIELIELEEAEWVDDEESGMVVAIMVGDDYNHIVDVHDLIPILTPICYCGSTYCAWGDV